MAWRVNRVCGKDAHKQYTPRSLMFDQVTLTWFLSFRHYRNSNELQNFSLFLTVLRQSKDLKKEMLPLVKSFLVSIKKNVEALSKRHRQERCHLIQVERERDQEAADAVNKYYQVLSLRDIRQEWSRRRKPLKSKVSSLSSRKSCNPTQWPFTETTNRGLTNVTLPWKASSHPFGRKYAFDPLSTPVTLEPNVRVVEETKL